MKRFYRALSFSALVCMFLAAILVFTGALSAHLYRIIAMMGTVAWFASVPFWMHRRLHNPPD